MFCMNYGKSNIFVCVVIHEYGEINTGETMYNSCFSLYFWPLPCALSTKPLCNHSMNYKKAVFIQKTIS